VREKEGGIYCEKKDNYKRKRRGERERKEI
jgi:hypothetical protein